MFPQGRSEPNPMNFFLDEWCWPKEKSILCCFEKKQIECNELFHWGTIDSGNMPACSTPKREILGEKASPKQPFPMKKYQAIFLLKETSLQNRMKKGKTIFWKKGFFYNMDIMALSMWVHVSMSTYMFTNLVLNFVGALCLSSWGKLLPFFRHFLFFETINFHL